MKKYEKVCKSMHKYEKVWKSMKKYEKIWKNMKKYEKVWKSMKKYEKTCLLISNFSFVPQIFKIILKNSASDPDPLDP